MIAVIGNTAIEAIYNRVGELPSINDIEIAKNYLTEDELLMLNNLVSGYFDFAEFQTTKHIPMRIRDYINQLDKILNSLGVNVLNNTGSISHKKAVEKEVF